jgi:phosphoserine phosphatase
LIEEVKEGINKLKNAGYLTFLISGGISIMVDEVKRLIDADFAYSNIIGEHDGLVDGTIEMVVGEKSKLIKRLSKEYEIDLENSIAIGNDYNDIDMFEIVGKGYAINPAHEGLIEKSELVFYSDNFKDVISDILDYQ